MAQFCVRPGSQNSSLASLPVGGSRRKLGDGIKGLERSVCVTAQPRRVYSITPKRRSSLKGLTALLRSCVEEEDANLPSPHSGTGHLLGMKACCGINVPLSLELFAVLTHEDVIKKNNRG